MEECLASQHKVLNSNPSTAKNKTKNPETLIDCKLTHVGDKQLTRMDKGSFLDQFCCIYLCAIKFSNFKFVIQ
jgi:hypothetical protein